jgi:plastocyanin
MMEKPVHSTCHDDDRNAGWERSALAVEVRATDRHMTMVTSYERLAGKAVCGFLLCVLGLLAPSRIIAQSTSSPTASEPSSATRPKTDTAGSAARTQLDGCLTTSDGLMPKLTLFHSGKIYRLEARPMLLTESPLLFANNINALVHVTGRLGSLTDMYDSDHSPVFIVETIDKLAPTCDVKVSLAQLRKQLGKPRAAASNASSAAARQIQPAAVVDMTGSLLVFEPATIEIKSGQTVVWKNSSREVHTVTADPGQATNRQDVELPKGAQMFDSGFLNPTHTYEHTFKTPGTYRYVCTLHEVQRMVGQVIVKP